MFSTIHTRAVAAIGSFWVPFLVRRGIAKKQQARRGHRATNEKGNIAAKRGQHRNQHKAYPNQEWTRTTRQEMLPKIPTAHESHETRVSNDAKPGLEFGFKPLRCPAICIVSRKQFAAARLAGLQPLLKAIWHKILAQDA